VGEPICLVQTLLNTLLNPAMYQSCTMMVLVRVSPLS
jgi:hypothetical protein